MTRNLKEWIDAGGPYIWLNAGAVSVSVIMVAGLLLLIAVHGLGHFWPGPIAGFSYTDENGAVEHVLGEFADREIVPRARLGQADPRIRAEQELVERRLIKTGNRDFLGIDFRWVLGAGMGNVTFPTDVMAVERREWGNLYGYLVAVKRAGKSLVNDTDPWPVLRRQIEETGAVFDTIRHVERDLIGAANYRMERLRLEERGLELNHVDDAQKRARIHGERTGLKVEYERHTGRLVELYARLNEATYVIRLADGSEHELPIAKIVRAYRPNEMPLPGKLGFYALKLWEFMADEPREANTEGGIFPAIFGTVLMVMIMAVLVTPFGVMAAVYLREYAKQGTLTRLIRIAVNNLAGVPSVVYGMFGLGFFVYFLGGSIDAAFFAESLPAPTFGTPGLLWASLTLALLTVPVVIVSTEEGLTRVPRAIREGSLALGATKAETLWRTVLPMTASAMMTGLILAVARAAGEVAPLMLVGVVKLAPSLALDGNAPFLHLDRKFMHLGFHIYDVGFQSPNVEAARPLVYASALLLVFIVVVLNLTAIRIRNRLRQKYRAAEQN
ncbi:MAG: phosphate ABC transporter permease PstA [Gammaproteobacteria bacterium]|nr:phosphate ABC transporter permease PstA [Gammaproteobacteria bacterium]